MHIEICSDPKYKLNPCPYCGGETGFFTEVYGKHSAAIFVACKGGDKSCSDLAVRVTFPRGNLFDSHAMHRHKARAASLWNVLPIHSQPKEAH